MKQDNMNPLVKKRLEEHFQKRSRRPSNGAAHTSRRSQALASRQAGLTPGNGNGSPPPIKLPVLGEGIVRFTPLGGLGEVGKNLNILEYGKDAIIVDAGFKLGIDLPGINFAIPELAYVEHMADRIRAIVLTHGHLDHIGALPYVLPLLKNVPIYGSRLTLGMVERQLQDRDPSLNFKVQVMNPDNHDRITIGPFTIELVRVTHSIPDSCAAIIDTPVGRIVHTGDFKFDPNPLGGKVSDLPRIEQIGTEGVLLLMSDSTNCERLGRTLSESIIGGTLDDLIQRAPGRVIISVTSTNINRIQLIIDAAVKAGRKVAIDGRSMLSNIEMAVRLGYIKIPRGTVMAMQNIAAVSEREMALISTGHQGEINSVLTRMASGEHKHVKLKPGDTVIMSSSPIPGNERAVTEVVDRLLREGARVFQNSSRELDKTGVLHVSGHGNREELAEMISLTKPQFFLPIHGEYHHQVRHAELAIEHGLTANHVLVADNGDVLELTKTSFKKVATVPAGMVLVDQTGEIVPHVVIKDRLLMREDGIVVVVLTIDRLSSQMLTSPDIISRGFIYMKGNEELMNELRTQLRQFTLRRVKRVDLTRFKQELRDTITHFLFQKTQRTPMVIPVVNVVDRPEKNRSTQNPVASRTL